MKLVKMLKKILSPFKSPLKNLLFALLMTWLYFIIALAFTPVTLSEAETPESWMTSLHFALMTPGLVYFIFSFREHFKQVNSRRFILYPLIVFSVPVWGLLTLMGYGASILWFSFFLFPVLMFGIPGAFIFGLSLDMKKKK